MSDLLTENGRDWNLHKLDALFPESERDLILQTKTCGTRGARIPNIQRLVIILWNLAIGCRKTFWRRISLEPIFQQIWKLETSPKIKHFLWKCISEALSKDASCLRCGSDSESVNHVLFQCPYARLVWAMSPILRRSQAILSTPTSIRFSLLIKSIPKDNIDEKLVPWLLWRIWKNRNDFQFL